MSYFLLIDLLRSIQLGHSTSFPTALFLRQKQNRKDNTTAEPPMLRLIDEQSKNPLTAILSLLADAHLVTTVFDPLTTQASSTNDSLPPSFATKMTNVPFTPGYEIRKLRQKLLAGLLEWKTNHFDSAPSDVVLLYHLCHLINLVPSLQSLLTLSCHAQINEA